MFELVSTSHFERRVQRFLLIHPDLRRRLAAILRDLEADPFQPHLRLHALRGAMEGLYAARVTHSYRITVKLDVAEQRLTLLDIGGHDEVYH
jgi:mRNA-degrading endonuclease YafQ of YafQ-DinJ toxin-antitoxin module